MANARAHWWAELASLVALLSRLQRQLAVPLAQQGQPRPMSPALSQDYHPGLLMVQAERYVSHICSCWYALAYVSLQLMLQKQYILSPMFRSLVHRHWWAGGRRWWRTAITSIKGEGVGECCVAPVTAGAVAGAPNPIVVAGASSTTVMSPAAATVVGGE